MKPKYIPDETDLMRAYAKHTRREPTPEERDVIKNTFDEDEEYQKALKEAKKRAKRRLKEKLEEL